MSPVISDINTQAYEPFNRGEIITQEEAFENTSDAIKGFMLKQLGDNNEKNWLFCVSGKNRNTGEKSDGFASDR